MLTLIPTMMSLMILMAGIFYGMSSVEASPQPTPTSAVERQVPQLGSPPAHASADDGLRPSSGELF